MNKINVEWNGESNFVNVKPYTFFDGTADTNASPGAEKSEVRLSGAVGLAQRNGVR